jgi:LmbE family N-acetylglucosaminyl deacetylase
MNFFTHRNGHVGAVILAGLALLQPARSGILPGSAPQLVVMCVSAHPDDEDGAALAYYAKVKGAKTYSIFMTRGEGGQNEIGSELYEDLGALRTTESLDAARILGSEIYFLGFPDFGFSKTARETFAKWGGTDSVLARLVYSIRALKPDIIITNHDTITTKPNRQHGNHQAAGISAYEAFEKAADPAFHPEQLSDTITAWQIRKLYFRIRSQDSVALRRTPFVEIDISARDSAGTPVGDIALSALHQHRSQGLDKLTRSGIPEFFRHRYYQLIRSDREYSFDAHDLLSGLEPGARVKGSLPGPEDGISLFAVHVSPPRVPPAYSGRFIVGITDLKGRRFDSRDLSVWEGSRKILERHYGPGEGKARDTLRLTVGEGPGRAGRTIRFIASAHAGKDSVVSDCTVQEKPVRVRHASHTRVGLVKTYDNTSEETLESFGIPYALVDSTELSSGDLTRYSVILLDLRTFAYRPDAVSNNQRLLDYVRRGGNIVCFYHKPGDWNGKQYPPYPILLTPERVTEEDAPVTLLLPHHRLLTEPNTIASSDWEGWVQERSIYLPSDDTLRTSARYDRILSMSDESEEQPPTSLLSARYGEGSYTYVSLALYRQLRELQPGAVRLFVNLVSQPRH